MQNVIRVGYDTALLVCPIFF